MASLKKVKTGDPLTIPAQTFNAFIDVAQDFQRRQHDRKRDPQRDIRQTGIVLARNESGQDRDRFDVLGIDAPIILPEDNADEFKQRVALRGGLPADEHVGRFVVLIEPLKSGAIGQAWIDGICPCRVDMLDEDHRFADAKPGDSSALQSGPSGSAQLLWVQPQDERDDPIVAWAIARIGSHGMAGGQRARITGFNPTYTAFTGRLIAPDGSDIDTEDRTICAWAFGPAGGLDLRSYYPFIIETSVVPVRCWPHPDNTGESVYYVDGLLGATCEPEE